MIIDVKPGAHSRCLADPSDLPLLPTEAVSRLTVWQKVDLVVEEPEAAPWRAEGAGLDPKGGDWWGPGRE